MKKDKDNLDPGKIVSRRDYQEILLAKMAGGDLYANEQRMKLRRADMMLDKLRIAMGEKPMYPVERSNVRQSASREESGQAPAGLQHP